MRHELADWLTYLSAVGYGELRRDAVEGGSSGGGRSPHGEGTVHAPSARSDELARVATEASTCMRCALAEGRTQVVFGTGAPDAELMFIGEGPGYHEDRQGEPFVGPAGELLTRIIRAIGRERDDVYIANIVKCRPPGNRDPQPQEIAACRRWLDEQIRLVAPRVIVALGRVAAQALLGTDEPMGKVRGRWYRVASIDLMPTYHPAALLRNQALKRPVWEDMQQVQARLDGGNR